MDRKEKSFLGLDCLEINIGHIQLLISKSVGPRILSFCLNGGENIFAEVPDQCLECPGKGKFYFYGGHRFWCGPEDPSITYIPDSRPITIKETSESIELIQEVDPTLGIQKSMRIMPTGFENILMVDHIIKNTKDKPFRCAPWAITQLKLGGTVILPQHIDGMAENPLLPNRSIVLWPYSDVKDPRFKWDNQFITIHALPIDKALKVGIANPYQWIAYYRNNLLFVKYASDYPTLPSIDYGATSQCYCNSRFIELETLGPLVDIQSDEEICHREIWRAVEDPFAEFSLGDLKDFFLHDEMTKICLKKLF
jgi:hypothetical protein